jgi:hypothetical protein
MEILGQRICIAGSAAPNVDPQTLAFSHAVVSGIARRALREGATIMTGIGREPLLNESGAAVPLIFDWTVMAAVWAERTRLVRGKGGANAAPACVVGTHKTSRQIPKSRKQLWRHLISAGLVDIRYVKSNWTAGALRRQLQADLADVLVVIGGGQGVEHLAMEFIAQKKPVIPLDIPIGSFCEDGRGAPALFEKLQGSPRTILRLSREERVGAIVSRMETTGSRRTVRPLVAAVFDLIKEVDPLHAFYVRLLNPDVPEFPAVEQFFRKCVDPMVRSLGFIPIEMGQTKSTGPWMNVEIFKCIHTAAAVVVDLTGLRQNCFMELGYAFGRNRKVIVTARKPTQISFDASAIEAFLWSEARPWRFQRAEFLRHWERNIQRGPLVNSD